MKQGFLTGIAMVTVLLSLLLPSAMAQKMMGQGKHPHIGYVYPAGARQGTTNLTVKLGGENVYGATAALVSGSGVFVEVIDSRDPEEGVEFKKRKNKKRNQAVIDEIVTLRVTVAPDAKPGNRDICLVRTNALSNKLTFQVGQVTEITETEPNNKLKAAMVLPSLPAVVNGVIMPGDVDSFKFQAVKGQHLVAEAAARLLLPYIADGVPGWFQAIVTLYDSAGQVVALANDFQFSQDPVLFYDVPADGEYTLTIRDSIYRGREDFVYRLRIGELPFITGVFPLGAPRGNEPVKVRLSGVNLLSDNMMVTAGPGVPPRLNLISGNKDLFSNPALFAVSDLPERVETEPATREARARTVELPVILNGCIRAPGEKHYTRFAGRKGQTVSLEVQARRLGSPLDSMITLMDSKGKVLVENDDMKDKGEGFITHQADSGLITVLPEAGTYVVMITDKQGRGGAEYAYRLRISGPLPDFALRMIPAAVCLPSDGAAPLTIQAIRRDNFTGPITVSLEDSLPGLSLQGGLIPEGTDSVVVTISASAQAAGKHAPRLIGKAVVEGRVIVREAVPAENLMQAFLYQHLLPFREQTVLVTRQGAPFSVVPQSGAEGIVLTPGSETRVPVTVTRRPGYDLAIKINLVDPPKGISIRKPGIARDKETGFIALYVDEKAEPVRCGNLIMTASMWITRDATPEEIAQRKASIAKKGEAGKPDAKANKDLTKVGHTEIVFLPALPFTVNAATQDGVKGK